MLPSPKASPSALPYKQPSIRSNLLSESTDLRDKKVWVSALYLHKACHYSPIETLNPPVSRYGRSGSGSGCGSGSSWRLPKVKC